MFLYAFACRFAIEMIIVAATVALTLSAFSHSLFYLARPRKLSHTLFCNSPILYSTAAIASNQYCVGLGLLQSNVCDCFLSHTFIVDCCTKLHHNLIYSYHITGTILLSLVSKNTREIFFKVLINVQEFHLYVFCLSATFSFLFFF